VPGLTHLVLLGVREGAPSHEVERALAAIEELAAVEGVRSVTAGRDVSVEGLASGFSHAAIVELADEAARDGYLAHPSHLAVAAQLEPLLDRLIVVDVARA
jgi:hypothetical protein